MNGEHDHALEGHLRCTRCTLPLDGPARDYLSEDSAGECNFCSSWTARWGDWGQPDVIGSSRRALDAEIARAQRRSGGKYDVLVPVSGGKDSLYVLDFLARNYPGIKLLAVTLDNGFLTDEALESAVMVTRALGVDHRVVRPPHILEVTVIFLKKTGHTCAPCQSACMDFYDDLTAEYKIPLVALGTSRRLDGAHPESANPWTPPFFDRVMSDEPNRRELTRGICSPWLLERTGIRMATGNLRFISLPDFIEWDVSANRAYLTRTYGVKLDRAHGDCMAAPVADYLYKRRCGFGQESAGIAAAVRSGAMSRDDGLERLSMIDEDGESFPDSASVDFLRLTGMTREDVITAGSRRPTPYFSLKFKIVGFLRRLLGLSISP